MPWSIKGHFIHFFFLPPTTLLTNLPKPLLQKTFIFLESLKHVIKVVNPHPLSNMRGSGPYGDSVHRLSDAKDYVKPGKSPLSRQGHRKMNQCLDDEYHGSAGGYLGDPRGRNLADDGISRGNPDGAARGRGYYIDDYMDDMCDWEMYEEAHRAGSNDGKDIPTLKKSRAKLKAQLGALEKQYSGTDRAKAVIIVRLINAEIGIMKLESGKPLGDRMWGPIGSTRSMPRDLKKDLAMLKREHAKADADLRAFDDGYDGTDETKSVFLLETEKNIARVEAEIRQSSKMPGGMAEANMATITRDISRLDVESREGAKVPHGKGASMRRRDVEDYADEESDYQPRRSHHGGHPPPAGHGRSGVEDYADEGSHYQPRGSRHSHQFPHTGHSRPGPGDYADEESDYQPRSSRHERYPPPAGHGRRAGR